MTNGKAQAGGQRGKNGEFYKGGQFLPSSESTIKGEFGSTSKKARAPRVHRQKIGFREWAEVPEGKRSIYQEVAGIFAKPDWDTGKLVLQTNPQSLKYFNKTEAEVQDLVDRWNAGERWM
jgi:hypothetical protein